eukprot:1594619-Rhodomonas_salina.1
MDKTVLKKKRQVREQLRACRRRRVESEGSRSMAERRAGAGCCELARCDALARSRRGVGCVGCEEEEGTSNMLQSA